MQKLYSQIVGLPVYDEHSISPIALVQDVIIDPETGFVVAFLLSKKKIVVPLDVTRLNSGLYIHDQENLMELDEVMRVTEVLKKEVPIMGARVMSLKKKYIGKVVDFEIDTKAMALSHILTAKTIFFLHYNEREFSRSQIITITSHGITVKDVQEVPVKKRAVQSQASSAYA